jgi:oxygen-dependent protoporphyrinogen oxidase
MPARYALAGLLDREREAGNLLSAFRQQLSGGRSYPPISFADGLQTLPAALADTYADRVRLETPVTAIRRVGADDAADAPGSDAGSGPYALDTADGTVTVESVVVTTPADAAADLLAGVAPTAAALSELRYNPLALVHLRADCDREGYGYQVGFDEDLHTLGASWNASMFDRDGVYTVFLGGMHEPDLVDEDDDTLGSIAAREFETVMGAPASVLNVSRLERGFPAYDESWAALDDLSLPDGVRLATNYTARMGVPSRVREARELAEELATRYR